MNGIELLADTNFIINMNLGVPMTESFLDYKISATFITEIELLSAYSISKKQREIFKEILNQILIYNFNDQIKQKTIEIRNQYKLKIPDAIIAATALVYDLPLLTFDREFEKIHNMNVIFLQKD